MPSEKPDSENMEIWDKVKHTDPIWTKSADKGKRKETTVRPMYNVQRATELFGPCGKGWGFEVASLETFADPKTGEAVLWVKVKVWYRLPGSSERYEIEQFGGNKLITETKGTETKGSVRIFDDDAAKKATTDALGKALTYLGFGADIQMGLYDNAKYRAKLDGIFGGNDNKPSPGRQPPQKPATSRRPTADNFFDDDRPPVTDADPYR